MEIKLVNSIYNFYDVEVKVKREKPEYHPWQNWFGTSVLIEKAKEKLNGREWIVISRTDDMDKIFNDLWGNGILFLKTKKDVIEVVKQIIISTNYKHWLYENLEIEM